MTFPFIRSREAAGRLGTAPGELPATRTVLAEENSDCLEVPPARNGSLSVATYLQITARRN